MSGPAPMDPIRDAHPQGTVHDPCKLSDCMGCHGAASDPVLFLQKEEAERKVEKNIIHNPLRTNYIIMSSKWIAF